MKSLLLREIQLGFGRGGGPALGLIFFLSLIIVFTFGIGPDKANLARIGPAILWAGPVLSILLGLERVFQDDMEDGTFELYQLEAFSRTDYVIIKALAYWITHVVPLFVMVPIFAVMLGLSPRAMIGVALSLCVGTVGLVCLGLIGAAVTASIRGGGMLLAILIIPFQIPVLIFGLASAGGLASDSLPFKAPFLLLCALTLLAGVICVIAAPVALARDEA